MNVRRTAHRGGFTLVELLVVITIIGMLMALLLPAVNAARESGRTNTCANNMRNITLAILQYESTKGSYPALFGNRYYRTDAARTFVERPLVYAILPELDRSNLFKRYAADRVPVDASAAPRASDKLPDLNLEILVCPSDPQSTEAPTSYVYNNGNSATPTERQANGVFQRAGAISSSYLLNNDGLQTTLMVSENLDAGNWNAWWTGSGGGGGGGGGLTLPAYETIFVWHDVSESDWPNYKINARAGQSPNQVADSLDFARPSSNHGDGVNVSFCDGHLRFINEAIDYRIYVQLMTSNSLQAVATNLPVDFPLDEDEY